MKKLKIILAVLFMALITFIACYDDTPVIDENGNISEASFFQKGKWLTEAEIIALIQEHSSSNGSTIFTGGKFDQYVIIDGNESALELNNFFYMRRQTNTDPFSGIRYLEEINDRDWFAQVTNSAGNEGTFFWMDGNPGGSNFRIQAVSGQNKSDSDIWFTDSWMMFGQTHGIYNYKDIKTFETNDEAKTYFETVGNGWSRLGTFYTTSDGTVKVTH